MLSISIVIFFRGPCLSRTFYTPETTSGPQFLSKNRIVFPVGDWHPYCILKRRWTAKQIPTLLAITRIEPVPVVSTSFLISPKVTSLRMRVSQARKKIESFPFRRQQDTCMTIIFRDVLFWISFIRTFCTWKIATNYEREQKISSINIATRLNSRIQNVYVYKSTRFITNKVEYRNMGLQYVILFYSILTIICWSLFILI
jgi:hypothetical protein